MPWHTSEMTDEMLVARNTTRAEHTSHHRGTSQRDCLQAALSPAAQRLSDNRAQRLSDNQELTDAELTDASSRQLDWMLHRGGRRSPASKSGARSASPPERRRRPLSDAGPSEPAVGERRTMGELKKVLWLERQRQHQAHELRLTFGLPDTEEPLDDFSCALQKAILLHGRLFVSRQHVCFSSNVFGVRTLLALPFREVVSVSKGTQSLINPSIVIMTKSDQHIFASFWKRDNVRCK